MKNPCGNFFFRKSKVHLSAVRLILFAALAFGLTLIVSCEREQVEESIDLQTASDVALQEILAPYRTFYEEQMRCSGKTRSERARSTPKWEDALIRTGRRGIAAVMPLEYEGDYLIRSTSSPDLMGVQAISYLLLNEDSTGTMLGEVVYIIPDGEDQGNESSHFSGTIIVENLHGEFLAAYICHSDGSVMHYAVPESNAPPTTPNSRGSICWTYELWSATSLDGG